MKRIIAVATLATLAACQQAENAAPEADDTAAATAQAEPSPAAQPMAADGKPPHGKFRITLPDGTTFNADVKPDGTYSVTDAAGKVTDTGKWVQKSSELYCETSDKPGSKEKCYTETVDDKGVYTSKDPDTGQLATIVRVEG